ncbi:MAG: polysaccharide deacetylase family protein [Lachnospiraceae bacterium]|nr:polysaccharide deacetylase family protein [Lachnospiraceae bacterium]
MKPQIALTFDDGPNTTITPLVLELLEKHGAAGTFFLIGQNINEDSKKVARQAFDMGFEIANHSFTHPDMTKLTPEEIRSEFDRTEALIREITGQGSVFFRPPFILLDQKMYDTIDRCFICGQGCRDWEPEATVEERIEGILTQACDGAIVLLHDMEGNMRTVEALKTVIPALAERGYEFVTLSALFAAKHRDPWDKSCRDQIFSVVNAEGAGSTS